MNPEREMRNTKLTAVLRVHVRLVRQVLDELGVSLSEGLVDVPGKKQEAVVEAPAKALDEKDQALEARFNNLSGK